ncbi:MAG: hypothetical protein AB1384_11535 [Actinomycetota bacterium]
MDCANCGKPVMEGREFCNYCGASLKPPVGVEGYLQLPGQPPPSVQAQGKKPLSTGKIVAIVLLAVLCFGCVSSAIGSIIAYRRGNTKSATEYFNEAQSHATNKEFAEAIADCDKAIKEEKDFVAAYELRGGL